MHITEVAEGVHLVDLETAGIGNFIASYVLIGKQVAIVETGPTSSVSNLFSSLKELNVKPEEVDYVAVTHIHLDHGGGAGTLLKLLPKARIIVHQRGAPHLAHPERLWQQSQEALGSIAEMYGEPEPVPEERIVPASDGMTLDIGSNLKLEVVETLGHASHHLSYFEPSSGGIFSGDAAGMYLKELDVVLPTTPSPFRLDIALASLDKLVRLKPKALYYSHFGNTPNPTEKLQTYAEQLKLWAKVARQGIENGASLEAIREKIVEADRALRRAESHVRTHPILSVTVLAESVRGILEFAQKFRGA